MLRNPAGFKGYIASRPFYGERTPQHVQNLVVRDYCQRNSFKFLLSATEYAIPDCFMILDQLIDEISSVDGIVAYSLFMLPNEPARRQLIYSRTLDADRSLHFAVEGLCVHSTAEIPRIENIWRVRQVLPECQQTLT
jgi:sporadic carbohydrate cluster protein (TIGR04323 family)